MRHIFLVSIGLTGALRSGRRDGMARGGRRVRNLITRGRVQG